MSWLFELVVVGGAFILVWFIGRIISDWLDRHGF